MLASDEDEDDSLAEANKSSLPAVFFLGKLRKGIEG
jgi:hypothetical protein